MFLYLEQFEICTKSIDTLLGSNNTVSLKLVLQIHIFTPTDYWVN